MVLMMAMSSSSSNDSITGHRRWGIKEREEGRGKRGER